MLRLESALVRPRWKRLNHDFWQRGGGQARCLNEDKKGAKIFESRECRAAYLVAAEWG